MLCIKKKTNLYENALIELYQVISALMELHEVEER